MEIMTDKKKTRGGDTKGEIKHPTKIGTYLKNMKIQASRSSLKHGGGVGIQTHGNKLAKALNTKRPDQSLFLNSDGYLTGGIKIRS